MIKHLTAIGNSFGIIIDKPILEILGIDKDTPLDVRTDGTGLIIRPMGAADAVPLPLGESIPDVPDLGLSAPSPTEALRPATAAKAPPAPLPAPPRPKTAPRAAEAPLPPPEDDAPPTLSPEEDAALGSGKAEVVVYLNDGEVIRRPFDVDEIVIGRDKQAGIHLDDKALSRRHAQLERRGASIWVSDIGSANGTFVNGEEIKAPRLLRGGDIIGLGHYRVHIEGVAEAASDTPVLTLEGPDGVHRFALVGEQVVIGRAQTCDIAIGHKSISRRHLKIDLSKGKGKFVVEDLGSQNGVKILGRRAKGPTEFSAGDVLEICEFSITLGYLNDDAAAEKPAAGAPKPRTMLIDKSALVNAAYFEGDFDAAKSGGASLALGKRDGKAEGRDKDTGEFEVPKEGEKGKVVRGRRG